MIKPREYILLAISISLLIGLVLLWKYPCLLSNPNEMMVYVDYTGYPSFKAMAQSVDAILVGRVESIYSGTWTDFLPYTTFNVTVLQVIKPSPFNRSSILVRQGGYHLDCRNVEVAEDPLMNVGEEYVFFLARWVNEDGTVRQQFLPSMGGLSMFLVRDGKVYPRFESWTPSVSGRSIEDVLNELNSYLT